MDRKQQLLGHYYKVIISIGHDAITYIIPANNIKEALDKIDEMYTTIKYEVQSWVYLHYVNILS